MARYFFDIRDAGGLHRDEVGDEFDSFEEARTQAIALLPDIAQKDLPDGERHDMICEMRDEAGDVIYRAELMFRGQRLKGGMSVAHD